MLHQASRCVSNDGQERDHGTGTLIDRRVHMLPETALQLRHCQKNTNGNPLLQEAHARLRVIIDQTRQGRFHDS